MNFFVVNEHEILLGKFMRNIPKIGCSVIYDNICAKLSTKNICEFVMHGYNMH